jgi:hypothetical protein
MLTSALDTRCPACNQGTIILVGRPGRIARLDGADVEVPRDFLIPTCDHCGADRLDPALANELVAALAKSQLVTLRVCETQEMDPIGGDDDDD